MKREKTTQKPATVQQAEPDASPSRTRSTFDAAALRPLRPSAPGQTFLFGDLSRTGFAFEWFDFRKGGRARPDGGRRSHRLEVCFNLIGAGELVCGGHRAEFEAGNFWFTFWGQTNVQIARQPQTRHQFLALFFSIDFLAANLPAESGQLHPLVQSAVQKRRKRSAVSEVRRLTAVIQSWITSVRKPPVLTAAQPLWYRAKALELACDLLFAGPQEELFCLRQQRLAAERTTRVKRLLAENLAEPPSLKELGRRAGCSPYYLSRIFSQEAGMTIPQYLRQIRVERAAELLREGKLNVTEVALEVGYNSISHFSQAFCQTMGCCPAMYPMEKLS